MILMKICDFTWKEITREYKILEMLNEVLKKGIAEKLIKTTFRLMILATYARKRVSTKSYGTNSNHRT